MPITSTQQAAEVLTFTRTAQCAFSSSPQEYTYKVPEGMVVAPLDQVVVDGPKGLVVVRVVSVNGTDRIDPHAKFEYKWLMQVVDTSGHELRQEALAYTKGPKEPLTIVDGQVIGG